MKEWNAKHIHDTLLGQSESAELQEKPCAPVQCVQNNKGLVHQTELFIQKGFYKSRSRHLGRGTLIIHSALRAVNVNFFLNNGSRSDQTMKPRISRGMFCLTLVLFLSSCLAVSTLTITTERRAVDGDVRTLSSGSSSAAAGKRSTTLFLLTGHKPPLPPLPSGPRVAPKAAEVEDGDDPPAVAELPPKPLPQTMLPRNMTADALKPPLGAAQVAPPPRQLVDVDVCRYSQKKTISCRVVLYGVILWSDFFGLYFLFVYFLCLFWIIQS